MQFEKEIKMAMGIRRFKGDFISIRSWDGLVISSPDVQSCTSLENFFDEKLQLYLLHERRDGENMIYIGETCGRVSRPGEGRRFVSRKMISPAAVLFFANNPTKNRRVLRHMEGRVYFALRRSCHLTFCNTAIPLSSNQSLCRNELEECERYLIGVWRTLVHLDIATDYFLKKWVGKQHNHYEMRIEAEGIEQFADGTLSPNGFTVKKGSPARSPKFALLDDHHHTRSRLMEEGILRRRGSQLIFTADHLFPSAYAAASVISGSNSSKNRWVQRGTGFPLGTRDL